MTDSEDRYIVVTNDEEQYSIWREGLPLPAGWKEGGARGDKSECLDHICSVWKDSRPLSARAGSEGMSGAPVAPARIPPTEVRGSKSDLVARLEPDQAIEFAGRLNPPRAELEAQLARGRVYIRFA